MDTVRFRLCSRNPGSVGDRGGGLGFEEFPFGETVRLL